jgi:hypothetical protein
MPASSSMTARGVGNALSRCRGIVASSVPMDRCRARRSKPASAAPRNSAAPLRLPNARGYAAQELISINVESARSTDMVLKFKTTVPVQKADPAKVRLFVGRGPRNLAAASHPCPRRKVEFTAVGIVGNLRDGAHVGAKALTAF